ncbi:hypothetical protein M404DRAFT_26937 [Pisolithus tinctorius Marx 270]|uniref:Uncharacterized protein n=1 Tax=Pisolithus tinctorius Marx 270 TaxID=870435 RepID=A0A0C3NRZ0_PISTI|nr:hypothetical protein M404DRAFT_26937 [Pisolithus tinctorius Marx 270]
MNVDEDIESKESLVPGTSLADESINPSSEHWSAAPSSEPGSPFPVLESFNSQSPSRRTVLLKFQCWNFGCGGSDGCNIDDDSLVIDPNPDIYGSHPGILGVAVSRILAVMSGSRLTQRILES